MRNLSSLLILALLGCSDIEETTYGSIDDASNAGAFDRGWLPIGLPSTTTLIREAHDLDTNVGWIAVEYDPAEYARLTAQYRASGWEFVPHHSGRARVHFPDPPVEWWPDELRPESAQIPHTDVLTRLAPPSHRWWMFVLPTERHLFIWHGPESLAEPLTR